MIRNIMLMSASEVRITRTSIRSMRKAFSGSGTPAISEPTVISTKPEIIPLTAPARLKPRISSNLLRDENKEQYIESLFDLMSAPDIRFHLQHLAMQMLAHADPPMKEEADLVENLISDDSWRVHLARYVLVGRVPWFDELNQRGLLKSWLGGNDGRYRELALQMIQSVITLRAQQIEVLLLNSSDSSLHERLENILWRSPQQLTDALFEKYLGTIGQNWI